MGLQTSGMSTISHFYSNSYLLIKQIYIPSKLDLLFIHLSLTRMLTNPIKYLDLFTLVHGHRSSRQVLLRGPALPVFNPFIVQEPNTLNTDLFNMAATGPCFSSKGAVGKCISFRQCYPYFKQQDSNTFDNWILGMYDTCNYYTSQGRQVCII